MGFLQASSSPDQEEQLDDLYTVFRCHRDSKVFAENLQTVLLAIEGVRDEANEVPNDGQQHSWETAGVFNDNDGLLYLRNGE